MRRDGTGEEADSRLKERPRRRFRSPEACTSSIAPLPIPEVVFTVPPSNLNPMLTIPRFRSPRRARRASQFRLSDKRIDAFRDVRRPATSISEEKKDPRYLPFFGSSRFIRDELDRLLALFHGGLLFTLFLNDSTYCTGRRRTSQLTLPTPASAQDPMSPRNRAWAGGNVPERQERAAPDALPALRSVAVFSCGKGGSPMRMPSGKTTMLGNL